MHSRGTAPAQAGHPMQPSRVSSRYDPYPRVQPVANDDTAFSRNVASARRAPSNAQPSTRTSSLRADEGHRTVQLTRNVQPSVMRETSNPRYAPQHRSSSRTLRTSSPAAVVPPAPRTSSSSSTRLHVHHHLNPNTVPIPRPADEKMPSFQILAKTARGLISPSVLWPEIDSFIMLLVQMELYRAHAVTVVEQLFEDQRVWDELASRKSRIMKGKAPQGHQGQFDSTLLKIDLDRLKVEVEKALRPKTHADFHMKVTLYLFSVKSLALLRRMRKDATKEALVAFQLYWPPEDNPLIPQTPISLLMSTMSDAELTDFDREANGVAQELEKCQMWIKDYKQASAGGAYGDREGRRSFPTVESMAEFDRAFPKVTKSGWTTSVEAWMQNVGEVLSSLGAFLDLVTASP